MKVLRTEEILILSTAPVVTYPNPSTNRKAATIL